MREKNDIVYVCMHIYTYTYVYIRIYVHVWVSTFHVVEMQWVLIKLVRIMPRLHTYACVYTCIHIRMRVHMYTRACVCAEGIYGFTAQYKIACPVYTHT